MTTILGRTMLRMGKELEELEDSPREGIVCYPIDDNITHLQAEVSGPEDTPYFGGTFKIDIQIPERYPMEPPNCQFLTRVYHPNIDDQGRICLDILKKPPKGNWGPAMSVPTVLLSLRLLLANPNPDDPLLVEVAAEYKEHRELFRHKAAKYTQQYAMGNDTETNLIMTRAQHASNTYNTVIGYQFTRIGSSTNTCRHREKIARKTHTQKAEPEYEVESVSFPQPTRHHPRIASGISTHSKQSDWEGPRGELKLEHQRFTHVDTKNTRSFNNAAIRANNKLHQSHVPGGAYRRDLSPRTTTSSHSLRQQFGTGHIKSHRQCGINANTYGEKQRRV
ncbi:Ubiquitin-conjugating enzyme E2 T [Podila verticillata]|nr:Ubiquitin-conjugating enzyme E2 T [Podila verticillata]